MSSSCVICFLFFKSNLYLVSDVNVKAQVNLWIKKKKDCSDMTVFNFSGSQYSGRDGDGRDGPGDQHEWNHHTGGRPKQDGEVWGKRVPATSLCVWLDSTSNIWGIVYSMQACVYAALCMLLFSDFVDAPYLLLSVCALFRPLLSLLLCSRCRSNLTYSAVNRSN